jgi:hypothetical protein
LKGFVEGFISLNHHQLDFKKETIVRVGQSQPLKGAKIDTIIMWTSLVMKWSSKGEMKFG